MLLSRKIIIEDFAKAPDCVLNEMLTCEGLTSGIEKLTREKKIELIEKLDTKIEKVDFNDQVCLGFVSRFVEPNFFPFKRKPLREAYDNIINWEKSRENLTDLEFGIKTNDNPLALNACMIYKSCLSRGVSVEIDESPSQMLFKAKFFDSPTYKLRSIFSLWMFCLPKHELFSFVMGILNSRDRIEPKNQLEWLPASSSLDRFYYLSQENLVNSCPPKTHDEAILALIGKYRIIAADIDIDALELFHEIESGQISSEKFLINRDFYSMGSRFVADYERFYTKSEIDSIIENECVQSKTQLYDYPEFIIGIHPDAIETETLVDLIEAKKLESPEECVTFLSKDLKCILSRDELGRLLKNTGFINPCNGRSLSKISVDKLRKLKFKEINDIIIMDDVKKTSYQCFGSVEDWNRLKKIIDIDVSLDDYDMALFDIFSEFFEKCDDASILSSKMVRISFTENGTPVPMISETHLEDFIENLKNVHSENACLKNAIHTFKDTIWWNLSRLTGVNPFEV